MRATFYARFAGDVLNDLMLTTSGCRRGFPKSENARRPRRSGARSLRSLAAGLLASLAFPAASLAAESGVAAEVRTEAQVEPKKERSFDALVAPLLSFNSDEGMGFGLAGGAYLYGDVKPYRHGLAAQVYATSRGVQSHFLRYDGPRILGTPLRLEARAEYRRELFAPYYGPGNLSAPEYEGEARSPRFSYDRRAVGGWMRLRWGSRRLQPYAGFAFKQYRIGASAGSLLAEQAPLGIEGGPIGQVLLGLSHDTRDDESDPSRGGSQELSLRWADRWTGSAYRYGQATLTVRHFVPLGSRLVLGGRVVADALMGEVPFFEWPQFGGLAGAEGIGGMSSVRGVPRHRYGGTLKVLGNLELRATLLEGELFDHPIKLGAVAFADAGRAWAPGTDDGAWHQLHPSAGVGVRLVSGAAAFRIDYGFSRERQALYVTFGQLF